MPPVTRRSKYLQLLLDKYTAPKESSSRIVPRPFVIHTFRYKQQRLSHDTAKMHAFRPTITEKIVLQSINKAELKELNTELERQGKVRLARQRQRGSHSVSLGKVQGRGRGGLSSELEQIRSDIRPW